MPPDKRKKLIGAGGHRIKDLISETGADVWTISEEHMSVFAPTREVMEDVMERVNAILQEEEAEVRGGCSGAGERGRRRGEGRV